MENPNKKYKIQTEQYDVKYEDYVRYDKKFGDFSDDGKKYTVTDRNTPRQWLAFMVNDRFASVASNDGAGFTALNAFYLRVTKYYSKTDYLLRTLNGRRTVKLKDIENGTEFDILADSKDMHFTTTPGSVLYEGSVCGVKFSVEIFVPNEESCEIWTVKLQGDEKKYLLSVEEDLAFINMPSCAPNVSIKPDSDLKTEIDSGTIVGESFNKILNKKMYSIFALKNAEGFENDYFEDDFKFKRISLRKKITLTDKGLEFNVLNGADFDEDNLYRMYNKFCNDNNSVEEERRKVNEKWEKIYDCCNCDIPDKNLQYFLNIWLKNQVYLTMRYNRFDVVGYRDIMQDTWGHLLVDSKDTKKYILKAISKMYSDGRCPRQFDFYSDILDERDFMDSPIWIPITVCDYIKETGDFSILDTEVGYLHSDKKDSVLDHILLSLDYLYHSRGENGLLLMRSGDWLDGLSGINKYGEATSVFGTMATFYVQNLLAELLRRIGKNELADQMEKRSREYKKIVNRVAWDGNWYTYAFIDDEPIGSSKCKEGKIYLNTQSWAMMSGIYDDASKVEKMSRSINIYLMTKYGPQLNAPPYQEYGEKCGRLQSQRPGTFANGGIYLHGASFAVMGYCKTAKYGDALDLMQRILPNHRDNCDCRRTSEPYCVGNVYYGADHPCHGMNLYTWFSATPSWLIHDGFDGILGVKADYDGIKIDAHKIDDWTSYTVNKIYRGTKYTIHFEEGKERGIYVDGVKIDGDTVYSDKKECAVKVIF